MSRKIIGVTVGTPLSPSVIKEKINDAGYATKEHVQENYQPKGNYVDESELPAVIDTALAQAKESGEFNGDNGVSPTVSVESIDGGYRLIITDAEGSKTFDVMNGSNEAGGAKIHVGPDEPTDGSNVWIDTDEEADEPGGTGGAQSDWNAADGQPGHVLNRTHWTDRTETVLIPAGDYPVSHYDNSIFDTDEFYHCRPIKEGKKYLVNIAGNSMECVARKATHEELTGGSAFGFEIPYIGNMAIIVAAWGDDYDSLREEVDTGEQFLFLVYNPEDPEQTDGILYFPVDESLPDNIAVSITEIDETVHKLPNKYLPDYLQLVETVTAKVVFDGDMTGKETVLIDSDGAYAVKVSSNAVSVAELIGSTMAYSQTLGDTSTTLSTETAMDASSVLGVPGSVVLMNGSPVVISLPDDTTIQGAFFSAGTWFMNIPGMFYIKSLSCLVEEKEVFRVDSALLPPFGVNAVPFSISDVYGEGVVYPNGSGMFFRVNDAMKEQIKTGIIAIEFPFMHIGSTTTTTVKVTLIGNMQCAYGHFYLMTTKASALYMAELNMETSTLPCIKVYPLSTFGTGDTAPIFYSSGNFYAIQVNEDGSVGSKKLN